MIHRRKISLAAALLAAIAIPANAQTPAANAPATGQAAGQPTGQNAPSQPEYAPLSADELDSLVAPIALYPDALVAQVLGASTFPYEVVAATLWLKDNSNLTGESLAKAVDQQSWDPAVKALTQFPTVLDDLAKNLAWTSALGEASATQQTDVMAAVQRMRAKALAAGNLKSGPEIKVEQQAPQTIVIQPANPQIVYVPVYSPTIVYGAPIVVPGYYYRGPSVAVVSFGGGIVVVGTSYGGCCGWGWSYWGTNWHSHTVIYNRNIYVGNSYWRGGYYGGGYYRPPGYKPGHPGYRPPTYPGYGRPPATTLPAPNPGNRPGNGNGNGNGGGNRPGGPGNGNGNGNRPGNGGPTTLPANPGTRPGNGGPTTLPAKPGTRPGNQPSTRPAPTQPSTRPAPQQPSTRPAPQQPSARPATQPARTDSFSGSAGGRAQSARGNQSMGSKGGGGGGRRP